MSSSTVKELFDGSFLSCKIGEDVLDLKKLKNPSPADKLIAHFDARPESSYIALHAEFMTDKLTIRKKRKAEK
jgi:hypothetical protein